MSFSLDMSAFAKKAGTVAEENVRKTATSLFIAVMEDTPRDLGRAQGAWQMSIDAPTVTSPINIRSASEVKAEVATNALKWKAGQTLWFCNNLAYINTLEFGLYPWENSAGVVNGFSKKAPEGFVRLNVMRFQTFINQATRTLS